MEELAERAAAESEVETPLPAEQRLLVLRDSRKRKGKVVTIVSGFEGSEEELSALGKRLKVACGVGGSAKEGEVIIQGDVVDRVYTLLLEWGYAKSKKR